MSEKVRVNKADLETMIADRVDRALGDQADSDLLDDDEESAQLPNAIAANSPLDAGMLEGEPEAFLVELAELFVSGYTATANARDRKMALETLRDDLDVGTGQIDDIVGGGSDDSDVTANADQTEFDGEFDDVYVGTGEIDDIMGG